jgi:hypothetical protein
MSFSTHGTVTTHGTVRGSTIELADNLGLSEGQEVEVVVRPLAVAGSWGEGIRRSSGAAAGDPAWEEAMAQIERERKTSAFRDLPE